MEGKGKYIQRRDRQDNPYLHLQQKSVALLQQLSGEVWTDFNLHDPGVTILDLLNHALDELRYKLDFPLPDYLTDPLTGEIPFDRMGLLPFDELLRGSPVTPQDYEKLMMDNIPELTACRATFSKGYYEFTLYPSGEVDSREKLRREVERLYHANRNLCETLGKIRFGETPPIETTEPIDGTPHRKPAHSPIRYMHRDISTYRSVQWDFPDCYGINRQGPPPGAPKEEKARILQLQAYLLIFDFLLAAATQQAADKWPEIEINGIERLIDRKKQGPSPQGVQAFRSQQRKQWLEILKMVYGEDEIKYFPELPEMNRRRFYSFDITDKHSIPTVDRWLIEHLLLYPDGDAPGEELCKVSLFYLSWGGNEKEREYIQERFPAHITLDVRKVLYCQWPLFERLYLDWREALADNDAERIKITTDKLKRFIK